MRNLIPNMSIDFAFVPVGASPQGRECFHFGIGFAHRNLDSEPRFGRQGEKVVDHFKAGLALEEIDGSQVHQDVEPGIGLLLQIPGHLEEARPGDHQRIFSEC